jgi:hypothetical protein
MLDITWFVVRGIQKFLTWLITYFQGTRALQWKAIVLTTRNKALCQQLSIRCDHSPMCNCDHNSPMERGPYCNSFWVAFFRRFTWNVCAQHNINIFFSFTLCSYWSTKCIMLFWKMNEWESLNSLIVSLNVAWDLF